MLAFGSERARASAQHVAEVTLIPVADNSAPDVATRSSWAHSTPQHPRRRGALLLLAGAVVGAGVATLAVMKLAGVGEPRLTAVPALAVEVSAPAFSVAEPDAGVAAPSASVVAPPKPRFVAPKRAPKRDLLDTSN